MNQFFKKMAIAAFATLSLIFGATTLQSPNLAYAGESRTEKLVNVQSVLDKLSKSVLLVGTFIDKSENGAAPLMVRAAKGSTVVIAKNSKSVTFLTAKHMVIGWKKAIKLGVIVGKPYYTDKWTEIPSTDAVTFVLDIPNADVTPIKFNLEPTVGYVPAMAFGFWGLTEKLTGTMGSVNRSVCPDFIDEIYDFQTTKGLIYGDVLIYPGYSGGAVVDEYGRLIGISVILTPMRTIYVDARYIWNNVPELNKGKQIEVPVDPTNDVVPTSLKRLPTSDDDLLNFPHLNYATSFKNLVSFLSEYTETVDLKRYFDRDTTIVLGGVKYNISRIDYKVRSGKNNFVGIYTVESCGKYICIGGNGWSLRIELDNCST